VLGLVAGQRSDVALKYADALLHLAGVRAQSRGAIQQLLKQCMHRLQTDFHHIERSSDNPI